jgi:primase-polymerase (primpol)-like protein
MWKQHHCVAASCAQWFSLVIIWYQAATLLKSHVNRGEEEVSSLGESLSRILNDLQEAQATKEDKERWVMFLQPVSQTSGGDWTLKETIRGNG